MVEFIQLSTALEIESIFAQDFTPFSPDYKYDENTGDLIRLPEDRNDQAKIDSYRDTALDRILDRFLPTDMDDQTLYDSSCAHNLMVDDLVVMAEAMERAEAYRDEFGLSDELSMRQIYEEVGKRADDLKAKLENSNGGDIDGKEKKADPTVQ